MKISLKTATLAKDKGYTNDNKEWVFYDNQNDCITVTNVEGGIFGQEKTVKLCTQSELQKWLREEHNCIVEVTHPGPNENNEIIYNAIGDYYGDKLQFIDDCRYFYGKSFKTYEKALEAGLLEGLKAIKL